MHMRHESQGFPAQSPPPFTLTQDCRVSELFASFVLSCECGQDVFAVMSGDADHSLSCPCGREWGIRISAEAEPRPLGR